MLPIRCLNVLFYLTRGHETNLKKAIKAKRIATNKIYIDDIKRLEKELELLEETKSRKGLTVGDVMLTEMTMDSKRREIRELSDRICFAK